MKNRLRPVFSLFLALLILGSAGPLLAGELDGDYLAQGADADGRGYAGTVRIQSIGGAEAVLWRLESGEAYKGLGLFVDGVLGAAYGPADARFGVAVYRIDGGTLDGRWTMPHLAKGPNGREVLEGSPDLTGDYRIALGENPDGTTNYTGTVRMQRQGDVYVLAWFVPASKPTAVGLGVRQGNVLAVVYGSNLKGLGAVAYEVIGNELIGVWSSGSKRLGTETLKRQK